MRNNGSRFEIISETLRRARLLVEQGVPTDQLPAQLGISRATYYRWKNNYENLEVEDMKRIYQLEQENAQLQRIINDLRIEIAVLKEVASEKL